MTKEQIFKRWQELWLDHLNTDVEYDESTANLLEILIKEHCRKAVNSTLDEALNSGDGVYRP